MKTITQKLLWIGLATAVVLGAVWQFFPIANAQERLDRLPIEGQQYKGKNIPLSDFEKEFFTGTHVLKRVYDIDGQDVFLTIVDGTGNRHAIHDPFYCFKGAGWNLLSETIIPIKNGHAILYKMKKRGQRREALVWFSNGAHQYSSPLQYWWDATVRRITLGKSGEEPVLIILQPLGSSKLNVEKMKNSFEPLFDV